MPKLHSLPTSLGLVAVAAAVLVSASWADASVLCAHKNNKTGAITEGATPKLRAACKSSELPVDPVGRIAENARREQRRGQDGQHGDDERQSVDPRQM